MQRCKSPLPFLLTSLQGIRSTVLFFFFKSYVTNTFGRCWPWSRGSQYNRNQALAWLLSRGVTLVPSLFLSALMFPPLKNEGAGDDSVLPLMSNSLWNQTNIFKKAMCGIQFPFRNLKCFPRNRAWLLPSLSGSSKEVFFLFHIAERGNYFWLPNEHEVSEESTAQNLPKVDSTEEGSLQYEQLPTEGLGGSEKFSVMSRQDLQTLCCNNGCSMADLSTLC